MAIIINSNEEFLRHIPNNIQIGRGETSLYNKVLIFVDTAEDWVKRTFTGIDIFNDIAKQEMDNQIRLLTSRLIVTDAMRRAIPSIDIVLTPNGFGVVNSTNVAPASKPRVDRFIESMVSHRDECINDLLKLLPSLNGWNETPQASFFRTTLFQDLEIVNAVSKKAGSMWSKYLELQPQIIDIEYSLAEEWFSPELMTALRSATGSENRPVRLTVANRIKAQIVLFLKNGNLNSRALADIVNIIRNNKEDFEEWHNSNTAKLFEPPIFKNKRNASGYFF